MTTRAFYHARNIEIDLANLPPSLYSEIVALHGQSDPLHPVLTCLGNGQPMLVWRHQKGRYFVRHFPNGSRDGHSHPEAIGVGMSDEHRRQADYTLRAASEHGFDARLEVSTGNGTRLDVGVYGQANVGFEIQRSALSLAQAKARATKSFRAGWPTAWITDVVPDPGWADRVPTARFETRSTWSECLPARNTQRVVIGSYERERDRFSISGYRYRRQPKTVLLDELAYLMPAGLIVPVAVGKKGRVDLAFKESIEIIDSCTYPGASRWNPLKTSQPQKEVPQRFSQECSKHPGRDEQATSFTVCQLCPKELWAPISIKRGYCEECRLVYRLPHEGLPTRLMEVS